jgi:NAD(P)-dependent dehydrogenase (short-subunit alcohol dehydrogenase family)
MSLSNRTAVITGATGGLGSFLARTLVEEGSNLALLDRNPGRLATLMKSLGAPESRILARGVDLIDPIKTHSVAEEVVARFGRVDILLHLVGGWTGGKTLTETPADDLALMINQHIWTSFNVTKAFVPHLVKNGWGRVIMITSPSATRPGIKSGPYAIGKSGQEALILTLSQELKGTGVTANLLQVKTIDIKREKITAASLDNNSWTTLEELAASILYLVSDEAGAVNGAKIPLFGAF